MVNRGSARLAEISEIEDIVSTAERDLKLNLVQLENLNDSFLHSAKNISTKDFSGAFRDAFDEGMDQERRLIQNLNNHNLDVVRLFSNRYNNFLTEASSQSYVYETELIPTGK